MASIFFENFPTIDKSCILDWCISLLCEKGYQLNDRSFTVVKDSAWSYCGYYITTFGKIYLKCMPPKIDQEGAIFDFFRKLHEPVPNILGIDPKSNSIIMQDMGCPLREILFKKFDIKLICRAVEQFSKLQKNSTIYYEEFFKLGIPNWQVHDVKSLLFYIISSEKYFVLDGLEKHDWDIFLKNQRKIEQCWKNLEQFNIPDTIVQCDFHDNNILINDESNIITFIDFGELVISHPIFSILQFMAQLEKHHHITSSQKEYWVILKSYFKEYETLLDRTEYANIISTAYIPWLCFGVMCQLRLIEACGAQLILEYQPHSRAKLIQEINNAIAIQK
ncbi:MAG: hypothetical protein FJ161_02020 [Gammaproteobacteria bacterium]|nr:hypothetical protein [Gammaproteobacteria bacterium]